MTVAFVARGDTANMIRRVVAKLAPDAIVSERFEDLIPDLHRIDGLTIGATDYDSTVIGHLKEKAPKLRWMQALSSGVDHHLDVGLPAGVALTSGSGAHAPACADHALALTLSLLRQLNTFRDEAVKTHWMEWASLPPQRSLGRARCLVLGYGPIGAAVMNRLLGFDARVTIATRSKIDLPANVAHCLLANLDSAMPSADIVIACLPQAPETTGLLNRRRLAALPKGALIVNIGRGSLIDEEAMIELLESGHLGGAGLDVTAVEPLPAGHKLWQLPNVEITPHVAGRGNLTQPLLEEILTENLRRFLAGEKLMNLAATGPVEGRH
ncbi:MAG TPA: D-2-hydroxyacid dehydrogenase [Devosia sp.]|nr:D-2-hydroxyacid dehydrogenase [Devosia sp.]